MTAKRFTQSRYLYQPVVFSSFHLITTIIHVDDWIPKQKIVASHYSLIKIFLFLITTNLRISTSYYY